MTKKILAITGIRSEYDILYPVIHGLRSNSSFDVRLIVCGAHLSDVHGNTVDRIMEDGFTIADRIDNLLMTNRVVQRAKGTGLLTYAISQTVEREQPDFLVYVGDREEGIATAIVANYMDVLFCHLGGGDTVYGNADDAMRFAISRLAHVHFTFAEQYADNLKRAGEEAFRVFWTGNPSLDNIRATPELSIEEVSRRLGFTLSSGNYIVLLKHPLSSEKEDTHRQMSVSVEAVREFCAEHNMKAVGIYPNTDPGCAEIVQVIENQFDRELLRFYKTLPRDLFVNLLRHSSSLAGNSSMGILEAPFYGLPVVNVGNRQQGRLNAGNVEFVEHDKQLIKRALSKACIDQRYRAEVKALPNPFGDGHSAVKIKNIIESIDPGDKRWHIKEKMC